VDDVVGLAAFRIVEMATLPAIEDRPGTQIPTAG